MASWRLGLPSHPVSPPETGWKLWETMAVSSSNSPLSLVVPVAIIALIILRRQGVRQGAALELAPRQRLRPLAMVWIDPLLAFLFAGEMLWTLIARDVAHGVTALAGIAAGIAVGYARGRVVYVRAVPEHNSIVIRRTAIEYALLAGLLILRMAEDAIAKTHTPILTFVLCGLIAMGISESIARAATLTIKFRRDKSEMSHSALPPAEPDV